MGRWEPNARGRLEQAAAELFEERGYARTTVEDIAARAGLTERTFFRYYADKREVLFSGAGALQKLIADAIADAPEAAAPLDAVAAGLERVATILEPRREFAKKRQALITAHADLQERESIKLRSLASAAADALRKRGVGEPAATLTSEAGMVILKVAYERWIDDPKLWELSRHVQASLDELKALTAGRSTAGTSRLAKLTRRQLSKSKRRPARCRLTGRKTPNQA
jgi:AcrR family transcriptional regulator